MKLTSYIVHCRVSNIIISNVIDDCTNSYLDSSYLDNITSNF